MHGAEKSAMDHQYIEEHNLADRYLTRNLPPDERARFEEHFVDCPECLDRLALAEMFRESSQETAAAATPRTTTPPPRKPEPEPPKFLETPATALEPPAPELVWRFKTRHPTAVIASVILVLLALPAAFPIGLRVGWLGRAAAQPAPDGNAAVTIVPSEHPSASIFMLQLSAAGAPQAGPAHIVLPSEPQTLVIAVDRHAEPEIQSYRASIVDAAKKQVFSQDALKPAPASILGVPVPSNVLHEGAYTLSLEELGTDGQFHPVGQAAFQVTK